MPAEDMVTIGRDRMIQTRKNGKVPSLKKFCCQAILVAKGIGKETVDEAKKKAFIESLPIPLCLKDMLQVYHKEKFVLGLSAADDDCDHSIEPCNDNESHLPGILMPARTTMRLRT